MSVPHSFELAFVWPILNSFNDFYSVCNSHRQHRSNGNNEFPCFRFDWSDAIDGMALPDSDYTLEGKLQERFYDDLNDFELDNYKDELGFEIFFDMNGYRMLADIPIKALLEEREEKEEDMGYLERNEETTQDDKEDLLAEIERIDRELVKAAQDLQKFIEFRDNYLKSLKGMYNDDWWVVVIDEDDEYDIVSDDRYQDEKEINGWRKWTEKEILDEREAGKMPGQEKLTDFMTDQTTLDNKMIAVTV